jgi:glycosyltransferase involved in cell wall biosynthesis
MPLFTVFTPTFNRAHTLPRVFESLRRQTFVDFEWLVVDDGSTDGTADAVAGWQSNGSFEVRYLWQPNRGKHAATNVGLAHARGKWFASIDSDDELTPRALEAFDKAWSLVPSDDRARTAGVWGHCMDESGRTVGDLFPQEPGPRSYSEMRFRYHVTGEKWAVHRLDVLRKFPYPDVNGNYVPEALIYMMIDQQYESVFVNETVRVYWSATPRDDQMSVVRHPIAAATGHALWHGYMLSHQLQWFRFDPLWFLRTMVHYSRFSFHAGKGIRGQWRGVHGKAGRLMWLAGIPLGAIVYFRDRILLREARSRVTALGEAHSD